jgi:hypothetical protein
MVVMARCMVEVGRKSIGLVGFLVLVGQGRRLVGTGEKKCKAS